MAARSDRPITSADGPAPEAPGDQELVARALAGDEPAFRRLVERHQDRIYGVALRLMKDRNEALEAAQDAFVKAWRSLPRFENRSRFTTWLHRIVLNVCYDRLGRRGRRPERPLEELLEQGVEPAAGPGWGGDEGMEEEQGRLAFEAAVGDLGETYRAAFILRQVEGRSYEEIAGRLGISETNAKVRVHRAREMIVKALRDAGVL